MSPHQPISREGRIAWWSMLALPAAVPLAVGIVPFARLAFAHEPFVYPRLFVLALLVAVSAVAWAVGVHRGTILLRSIPGRWWLAAFLTLGAASTIAALDPTMAFFGGKYQRVGFMVMLLLALVFVLLVQLVDNATRLRALAWSTIVGGCVASVLAILQSRDIDPLGMARTNLAIFHRGQSVLGNPDFTATYLVVPLVLAAALTLSSSRTRSRVMSSVSFGLIALAIAISMTRGAWIGALAGMGALAVSGMLSTATRRRTVALVGGLVILLMFVVVVRGPAAFTERFSDLSSAETAGSNRLVLWQEGLAVAQESPLFGTGADSYPLGWYSQRSKTSMRQRGVEVVIDDPHNLFLLLAATLGIPAALAAAVMFLALLKMTAPRVFARDSKASVLLYAGWWAALLGILVALLVGEQVIVTALMLAVTAGALAAARAREGVDRSRLVTAAIDLVAVAAVGALAVAAISLGADVLLRKGSDSGNLALIDKATSVAPWHAEAQYLAAYRHSADAAARLAQGDPGADVAVVQAEERLERLIEANPHEYASHMLFAHFLAQQGAIDERTAFSRAREEAAKALELYPLSPIAGYYKALAEVNLGDESAAEVTLAPVWDVDPGYSDAGVLYVRVLAAEGKTERATEVFSDLSARFPADAGVQELKPVLEVSRTQQ